MKYSKNKLQTLTDKYKSYTHLSKKLNISVKECEKLLKKYKIDCSHFLSNKRYKDLIGKKINMLTVLSIEKQSLTMSKEDYKAKCKCDCGNIVIKNCINLKYKQVFSCGCLSKNRLYNSGNRNKSFKGVGDIGSSLFNMIKHNSKTRNICFELNIEYLWELFQKQSGKCALSGLDIKFGRFRKKGETTASLDRIDSNKGYVEGNVQWVHKDINQIKSIYDEKYFIKICNLVHIHNHE